LVRARAVAGVERRAHPADAAAGGDAAVAVRLERDGREAAVLPGADLERLHRRRTIADAQVLLLAVEHEAHRGARLLRERHGERAEAAEPELGAEAAPHELGDH